MALHLSHPRRLILSLFLLALLAAPCVLFRASSDPSSPSCSESQPRPLVSYESLAANVNRVIAAPPGTTMAFHFGERQLESFLNAQALPQAGLGAVRVGVRLHPNRAQVAFFLQTYCFAVLELHQHGEETPELALSYVKLGPLESPLPLRHLWSRVLNETLAAGDLGFRLRALVIEPSGALVTLSRE